MYDVNSENADKLVGILVGRFLIAMKELLEVVDGVIISSPNFCHKSQAVQALLKTNMCYVKSLWQFLVKRQKYMMTIAKKY